MSMMLTYKNDLGAVKMWGSSKGSIRICSIEGLAPVINEYNVVVYQGRSGQETISSQGLSRCISVLLEITGTDISSIVSQALRVLSKPGILYINDTGLNRRITCNQVKIPDITKISKGRIATFAVQFVSDNPYFEDGEDIVLPLYKREKALSETITMPCMLGRIVIGADVEILGAVDVEPIITLHYPSGLDEAENITITNQTIGKSICLNYSPQQDDTITIDVKNRRITSARVGSIINYLSDDTFLGDFIFKPGRNIISVELGDLTSGFTAQCKYTNLYDEAVIV